MAVAGTPGYAYVAASRPWGEVPLSTRPRFLAAACPGQLSRASCTSLERQVLRSAQAVEQRRWCRDRRSPYAKSPGELFGARSYGASRAYLGFCHVWTECTSWGSARKVQCLANTVEGGDNANPEPGDPQAAALQIEQLEYQLDYAVKNEDYSRAAQLRDRLRVLQEDEDAAVLAANSLFYKAFSTSDMRLMGRVWAHGDHVQCLHPGMNCIAGREQVLASWDLVLDSARVQISLEDIRVHTKGNLAYVTCIEIVRAAGSSGRCIATNIFQKHGAAWLMCLHQGAPAPMGM